MAVSSTTNSVSYTGNGTTATYSYTFKVFDQSHLLVTVRNTSTHVETTLALTTDYTVTGVGEDGGGTIVLVDTNQAWLDSSGYLSSSYKIQIRRKLTLKQETSIRNQTSYYPNTHEKQFDKSLMISQQQQDELDRAPKFSELEDLSSFDVTMPRPVASAGIRFNSTATGLESFTIGSSGAYAFPGGTGILAQTAALTATARTMTASWGMGITDGDGVSGNPTFAAKLGVASIEFADSPYTVTATKDFIECNAASGAITVNLPAAASNTGRVITLKKTDTTFNAVTIDPNGAELIDGSSSTTLNTEGESVEIVCNGTAWKILRRTIPSKWTSYTPGVTAVTSNPSLGSGGNFLQSGQWRRLGDSMEVMIEVTAGSSGQTAGSGVYKFGMPSGPSVDTAKITRVTAVSTTAGTSVGDGSALGIGSAFQVGGTYSAGMLMVQMAAGDTDKVVLTQGRENIETDVDEQRCVQRGHNSTEPFSSAGSAVKMRFLVPISGWNA